MMKKKMMAMMTAAVCMTACLPAVSQPVSAAYGGFFSVVSIAYAEGTDIAETYLLTDAVDFIYEVPAEEMEQYLVEGSALPRIGDVVKVDVELGQGVGGADFMYFVYSEDSTFEVISTMDEYYSVKKDYMVIRYWEDQKLYLLQDTETGDQCTYYEASMPGYTTPYQMEGAEVGDTISFYVEEMEDYELLFLPYAVTKGDGTIPDMPDSEITEDYYTDTVIVIGAQYSYNSGTPTTYMIKTGNGICTLGRTSLRVHGDIEELECGDVLMVDISSYLETSPGQIIIPQNGKIYNIGNAENLYGTKEFTVTENTGYSLSLEDADGNAKRYSTFTLADTQYQYFYSDAMKAQHGDVINFVLDRAGNPVIPLVGEKDVTPVEEYVVVGVDDAENPQNYIIMDPQENRGKTYHLSADVLADCLAEDEEMPAIGDILELTGFVLGKSDTFQSTMDFTLQLAGENLGTLVNDGAIRKVGTVYDNCTEIVMEYAVKGAFNYYRTRLNYPESGSTSYTSDFLQTYVQPGCADLTAMHYGDEVTMVVYNGCPVFPSNTVSPLGDANQDGALDVLDVVTLNKNIMGLGALPGAAARSGDFGQADFNGDGAIDGMDSLGVMKRIVGLE